jgi:hypothetical protein
MKKIYLFTLFSLLTITLAAQHNYLITKSVEIPELDGKLELAFWGDIPVTDSFTTALPSFGRTPIHATTVQMVYTSTGIYIGFDCQSDKIRYDLSQRDQIGTGDYCSVGLDTWNDDQNAFLFTVTAGGQRADARVSSTFTDQQYDAYWRAKSYTTVDGWSAEFYIPFTALRFPKGKQQDWGIQFTRFDRSTGELSTWNPQSPLINDIVLQYGQLEGLVDITQKVRMALSLSEEAVNDVSEGSDYMDKYQSIFALDGRIGLNSSSTLDFTILPNIDNGNVFAYGYDPAYNYQYFSHLGLISRQSKVEESGVFQKTDLLRNNWKITEAGFLEAVKQENGVSPALDNYVKTKEINTTRFTTRTKQGIGIGVSSSIYEKPPYCYVVDKPNTQYCIDKNLPHHPIRNNISIEKAFRNNSWVNFSNEFDYFSKGVYSNTSALSTQLRDKSNNFELSGNFKARTQKDVLVADGDLSIKKVNGTYTYGATYLSPVRITPAQINTLTYEKIIAPHNVYAFVTKSNYKPKQTKWLNTTHSFIVYSNWLKNRIENRSTQLLFQFNGTDQQYRNFWVSGGLDILPSWSIFNFPDISVYRKLPPPVLLQGGLSTDARKKIVCGINGSIKWNLGSNSATTALNITPRWVITPKLVFASDIQLGYVNNETAVFDLFLTKRYFSQSNYFYNNSQCQLKFAFHKNFYIELNGGLQGVQISKKHLYLLQDNGSVVKDDIYYYQPYTSNSISRGGQLRWFFTPTSQLFINYQRLKSISSRPIRQSIYIVDEEDVYRLNRLEFGLVWNLNRR